MTDRDRLKENIQLLNKHNKSNRPIYKISNGRKYEFDVINEIVEDVSLMLEKMENKTYRVCKVSFFKGESKMKSKILLSFVFLFVFLFSGCNTDEEMQAQYDLGYEQGKMDGYSEGYEVGYEEAKSEFALYPTGDYYVDTKEDPLTIRDEAAQNAKKLGTIPRGEDVNVTKTSSHWGYVTFEGISGWINLDYCEKGNLQQRGYQR